MESSQVSGLHFLFYINIKRSRSTHIICLNQEWDQFLDLQNAYMSTQTYSSSSPELHYH